MDFKIKLLGVLFVCSPIISVSQNYDQQESMAIITDLLTEHACEVLIFDEEFDEPTLNDELWDINYPWDVPFNNGLEIIDQTNLELGNGMLNIRARELDNPVHIQEDNRGEEFDYYYSGGAINSNHHYKYGKFEMEFELDEVNGSWPAFWLWNDHWDPNYPYVELDIFEFPGSHPHKLTTAYHIDCALEPLPDDRGCEDYKETNYKPFSKYTDQVLIAGFMWNENNMMWYLRDGSTYKVLMLKAFDSSVLSNVQIIINHAIAGKVDDWYYGKNSCGGSSWGCPDPPPAAGFPIDFKVHWVRLWKGMNRDKNYGKWSYFEDPNQIGGKEVVFDGNINLRARYFPMVGGQFTWKERMDVFAQDRIVIKPGFHAKRYSVMSAQIKECGGQKSNGGLTGLDDIKLDLSALFDTTESSVLDSLAEEERDIVKKTNQKTDLYIYPNPGTDFITLKLNDSDTQLKSVVVFNSIGSEVYSGLYVDQLDITSYSSGLYYITAVDTYNRVYNKKFYKR